jgi:hypothetical protein
MTARPQSCQMVIWHDYVELPKFTFGNSQEEKAMDGFLRHTPRALVWTSPVQGSHPGRPAGSTLVAPTPAFLNPRGRAAPGLGNGHLIWLP